MPRTYALIVATMFLAACAMERPFDPLEHYEQLPHAGIVDSPAPVGGRFSPADRDAVEKGRYLVVVLGCGACHTNGAFEGAPDMDMALAGSRTGIAWTNPLETEHPGVVFPSNITPDEQTGIGLLTDAQIANAIRAGSSGHGKRRLKTMPWQAYVWLTDDDVDAIIAYLRSIPPIKQQVHAAVPPGSKAREPFVYFGIYRTRS